MSAAIESGTGERKHTQFDMVHVNEKEQQPLDFTRFKESWVVYSQNFLRMSLVVAGELIG